MRAQFVKVIEVTHFSSKFYTCLFDLKIDVTKKKKNSMNVKREREEEEEKTQKNR